MQSAAAHRVLVTGGSGFIGTNLVDRLFNHGYEVASTDLVRPANPAHEPIFRQADLLDRDRVAAVMQEANPSTVVHLGARTDLHGSSISDYAANVAGAENVLDAASSLVAPPRLIVASTRMVCPIGYQPKSDTDFRPPNAYGESKVATERITREHGYAGSWCIARPTSIWGPWFGVPYRDFFLSVARGIYFHPGRARIRKSFGYVGNTAYQLQTLIEAEPAAIHARMMYLADKPIEVGEWAELIKSHTGGRKLRRIPVPVLRAAAHVGDAGKKLGWKEPPITTFRLGNLLTEMIYDTSPIEELAPSPPFDLESAVSDTVDWLRSRGDL